MHFKSRMRITPLPFTKRARSFQMFGCALALLLAVNGCTSVAFRTEANHFASAYGDVLNEQMLLNLARLDNGHPAYFVAVGTLTSKWNLGSTGGGSVTRTPTDNVKTNDSLTPNSGGLLGLTGRAIETLRGVVVGKTGAVNFEARVQPEFTLIPLNNAEVAQQVLQPTRSDVFYTLYEQGFPIDIMMRVLVEEIRTTLDGSDWVARNDPAASDQDQTGVQARLYTRFLGVCQIARDLQRTGHLKVEETAPKFVSLGGDPVEGPLSPEIVMKTQQGGASWEKQTKGWELGRQQTRLRFVLDGDPQTAIHAVIGEKNVTQEDFITDVIGFLAQTMGVQGGTTSKEQQTASERAPQVDRIGAGDTRKVRLVLRSFSRVLDAVAREQNVFSKINPRFSYPIPASQNGPVIQTRWDGFPGDMTHPIGAVRYAGHRYTVVDPKPSGPRSPTWNRDVFRMLIALNSQVAVDISKFQRQVLEVR